MSKSRFFLGIILILVSFGIVAFIFVFVTSFIGLGATPDMFFSDPVTRTGIIYPSGIIAIVLCITGIVFILKSFKKP